MIRKSFTLRVLAVSFIFLALPLLVYSFISFQTYYEEMVGNAKKNLKELASLRTISLLGIQPFKYVLLREIDYLLDIGDRLEKHDIKALNETLEKLWNKDERLDFFLIDVNKKILASSSPELAGASLDQLLRLEKSHVFQEGISLSYAYSVADHKILPFIFETWEIRSKTSGEVLGTLVGMSNIQKRLKSILEIDTREDVSIYFALLSREGVIFAASDPQLEGQYFDSLSSSRRQVLIDTRQFGNRAVPSRPLSHQSLGESAVFAFTFNEEVQLASRVYESNTGFSIVAYQSQSQLFRKVIGDFFLVYVTFGALFIFGGGMCYWFSLLISRPFKKLKRLMERVSRGELDVRFQPQSLGFEINILGNIFNNTLDNLLLVIQEGEEKRLKKESHQRELELGKEVQRNFSPSKILRANGVEIAGTSIHSEIVGDFYSYRIIDGKLLIMVGDISGMGISSCLYGISFRSLLLTYASLYDDVGKIVSHSYRDFLEDVTDSGVSVVGIVASYDFEEYIFSYYAWGAAPGKLRRANGEIVPLLYDDTIPQTIPRPQRIQLQKGDRLFLYSRGIVQAVDKNGIAYGSERLHQQLAKQWKDAATAIDEISAELHRYTGSVFHDGAIIVCLNL